VAVLNLSGWEAGDSTEASGTSGTFSVQGTTKRSGAYALQVNPTTTAAGYHQFRNAAAWTAAATDSVFAHNDLYVTVYFRYATRPAANDEEILQFIHSGGGKLWLRINSSGNLAVYNAAVALVATGTAVLAQDTWYRLDVRCGTSATIGAYEVKIDGTTDVSGTANTSANQHTGVRLGKVANRNGNTVDYFYDDLIISDTAYVGAGAVEIMVPTASGTYSQWTAGTGSTFADVDDVPHDSGTSYLAATAQNDASTFNLESRENAGISGTINGVKFVVVAARAGASNASYQTRARNGSTDSDSLTLTAVSGYTSRLAVLATDPNGDIAWTTGGLDSTEIGVEDNDATNRTRVSHLALHVHFTAAEGAEGSDDPDVTERVRTYLISLYSADENTASTTTLVRRYLDDAAGDATEDHHQLIDDATL
jgi:hypothetical protein